MPDLARFRALHADADDLSAPSSRIFSTGHGPFFVSVELLDRPDLRGKPVVVGGRPDQRGVVSAASYEARKYGIHSAMPCAPPETLPPRSFLDGHHAKYAEWSDSHRFHPRALLAVVEMVSVDEAYLDFAGTERMHGPPLAATDKLLRTITRENRASLLRRLATTRLTAKVASDQAKPRGLVWVAPGQEAKSSRLFPSAKFPGSAKSPSAPPRTRH